MNELIVSDDVAERKPSQAIIPQAEQSWLQTRSEGRDGRSAMRVFGQDAHDYLGVALKMWAQYHDNNGNGPSLDQEGYHRTFPQMIRRDLGLPAPKVYPLDRMSDLELNAVCSLELALATVLLNGMNRGELREDIKTLYKAQIKSMAKLLRTSLELAQGKWAGKPEGEQ